MRIRFRVCRNVLLCLCVINTNKGMKAVFALVLIALLTSCNETEDLRHCVKAYAWGGKIGKGEPTWVIGENFKLRKGLINKKGATLAETDIKKLALRTICMI